MADYNAVTVTGKLCGEVPDPNEVDIAVELPTKSNLILIVKSPKGLAWDKSIFTPNTSVLVEGSLSAKDGNVIIQATRMEALTNA